MKTHPAGGLFRPLNSPYDRLVLFSSDEKKNLKMWMIQGLWRQTSIRQLSFGIAHLKCLGPIKTKLSRTLARDYSTVWNKWSKYCKASASLFSSLFIDLRTKSSFNSFAVFNVKQWSSFSERLQRLITDVKPRKFPFVTNCGRARLGHQTALMRLITLQFEKYVLDEVIKCGSAVSSRSQVSKCFCLQS